MNKLEPIGHEFSVNLELIPELKELKKGEEIELKVKCVKIGDHTHSIGKKAEKMCDLQVVEMECDEEEEDEAEGDEAEG